MENFAHMVTLERLEQSTSQWLPVWTCHADVNKASGKEFLQAGAVQSQMQLVFTLRYCSMVAAVRLNTQLYRISYNGESYKIADYDDFQERHKTVKLLGVSYG